jgi:phenylpropionate dioxygenase-like ring-hydroxylating dioxygenase large terminal subunit
VDKDLQATIAKRLFAHIDDRTTDRGPAEMRLSERDYVDPERARLERDRVLAASPAVVAASKELAEPGRYLTVDVAGAGVLLARQEDRALRAFRNVCRHRCATVVRAPSGTSRSFSCHYHGWTYGLDGSLRMVPDRNGSFPDVDLAEHGLAELPVAERHGLVWLLPDPAARLDDYLGPEIDRELGELGLGDYEFLRGQTFDQPANWKLIMDGFLEVYHVRYLHPKTVGKITISNVFLVDALGDHLRLVSARKDIEKLRPTDGDQPDILPGIILTYALMPNTVVVYVRDHVEAWTITPHRTDPGRCRITLRFLVPSLPETDKQRSYWQRNWDTVVDAVHDEDWDAARRIQGNMKIDSDTSMVLGRNELGLHHFHRYLRTTADG